MKVLIVGGVAGGASTAARLRRLDEKAEIIMFERGAEISYANCGIPYHIGNVIKDRSQLTLVSKEEFKNMFNVTVRINTEVLSIDRKAKKVKVKDLSNNNIYEEPYDKLVLSPGGAPLRPPIPGINDSRIFTIRNLHDMDLVISFIKEKSPKKAVIVGAGFIGLEVAENLKGLGISVSVVELAGQVMNLMDFEMASIIHEHFKLKKVALYLNDGVKEFKTGGKDISLQLGSGRILNADMVVLSIGVKPEVHLAKDAGLDIGPLGGIKVFDSLLTTDPDIYALGDAIETKESVCNCPALIPLANAANKQGRIVADNITGGKRTYDGTPATAIAKVFDLTAAITGNSEKQLNKKGIKYGKVFFIPSSHAGYYPDAFPMTFKLLYDVKDGRVLGAQIVGLDSVDKRIDVAAAMIQMKKTVYDLAVLELAYAPPYSSAKDPINLAGMIAVNQLEGKNPVVYWNEIDALKKEGALFLDVRSPLEFDLGHIDGALQPGWGLIGAGAQVFDRRFFAQLTQGDLAVEGRRPLSRQTQIVVDPVLAAGLGGRTRGPIGGAGADPGIFGRIIGDALEGGEGLMELTQPPFGKTHRPPVADLAADGRGAGQVVVVVCDARRLHRIDGRSPRDGGDDAVPGPPQKAPWLDRFRRPVGPTPHGEGVDPVRAGQVGIGLKPGGQLFIGGDMVRVEQAFELDLTQQDAVLSLTRRQAGRLDVAAPQGVESGGVGQAIR